MFFLSHLKIRSCEFVCKYVLHILMDRYIVDIYILYPHNIYNIYTTICGGAVIVIVNF